MASLTWTAGQLVTAAELNLFVPLFALKGSNQSVTNSATLVNDNDIVFTLIANQTYHLVLVGTGLATTKVPGLKTGWTLTGTVNGTIKNLMGPVNPIAAAGSFNTTLSLFSEAVTASAGWGMDTQATTFREELILTSGASGGVVQLQFAQQAATAATTTTLSAGTFAICRVVA